MSWLKGFVRGVYALPIFVIRVAVTVPVIFVGVFVVVGEWAHGDCTRSIKSFKEGLSDLWGFHK
jgi:hypothetical protein